MSAPSFSGRFGFRGSSAEITVREDAPEALRDGLVMLAESIGLSPTNSRLVVCGVLLKRPDPSNWSERPNIADEVHNLVSEAPWYQVYDIAEAYFQRFRDRDPRDADEFQRRLNELFRENGIGWEMQAGRILARGSEAFEIASRAASQAMRQTGRLTAANEMHEALGDLSRRPKADVTGAVQHGMAALECVARDLTGRQDKTLGALIPELNLPKPLDTALEKLWGFASQNGRHIREGREPTFEEAQLVVTVASAVSVYLIGVGPSPGQIDEPKPWDWASK